MQFSIAAGAVLHIGGINAGTGTTPNASSQPTVWISGGDSTAASLLAKGIPQNQKFTGFQQNRELPLSHVIKHADITIISGAAPGTPAARFLDDGSIPTATIGVTKIVGEVIVVRNCADALFNSKIFNNGAGAMIVEVQVWE